MAGVKKVKAREEFIAFAERQFGAKFSTLNRIQQSRALVYFYIRQIHNTLKTDISDDDIELAIVDGGNTQTRKPALLRLTKTANELTRISFIEIG